MIGGKVLDASALARRRVSALVWFDIALTLGLTLYVPSLALAEVRAVRPDAAPLLADLLAHPSVVVGELDAAAARQVDQLLLNAVDRRRPDARVWSGGWSRIRGIP